MSKRNYFTNKFKTKTDKDLNRILESDSYVEDAKLAAKWILEDRGKEVRYQPPKTEPPNQKLWIPGENLNNERKKYYSSKLLVFGICCLISAFYFFFDSMGTNKGSLTTLPGTIKDFNIRIDNVSSRNRMGYEAKSRRATLFFSLNEYSKIFKLSENIGQKYYHQDYNRIVNFLKNSRTISVWIKKSDLQSIEPKVFQIDANDQTVLDFQTVKNEYSGVIAFLF